MNWTDANTECCKYSYELPHFETADDLKCFKNIFNG